MKVSYLHRSLENTLLTIKVNYISGTNLVVESTPHNVLKTVDLFRWKFGVNILKAGDFLVTGYAMECSIFMKGTGIRLAQAGYAVFGIDYEGHGKSDGKRCYIESFQDLVDDSIAFFKSVRGIYSWSHNPLRI